MKKYIVGLFFIFGCGRVDSPKIPDGYVNYRYINGYVQPTYINGKPYLKIGANHEYKDVLHNGDSLFVYYTVDSEGIIKDKIFYTSNGRTKTITWNVNYGKNSENVTNLQY